MLIDLYQKTYQHRLRNQTIWPEYDKLKELREKIFLLILNECSENISDEWTMDDLDEILKSLKNGKAIDPLGMTNEMFKYENISEALKESILIMMNKI